MACWKKKKTLHNTLTFKGLGLVRCIYVFERSCQQPLLQSHDPLDVILTCGFDDQETFLTIIILIITFNNGSVCGNHGTCF